LPESDVPSRKPGVSSHYGMTSAVTPTPGEAVDASEHPLPSIIGRYRILRLLGEGGMGAVYEAEQESPQRTVALKVIRAGYAGNEMLRRFENETQALGRLQHPGIAQIYDAGTAETPFGKQPYIAMELVRGQNLLAYCNEHQLSVPQRLELMARICDAVQHAHQRGLIHRDLKPANILVGEDGQPKILDFGVARLTDSDAQATRQTDVGQIIGTLAYMSPEQVLGDPDELDTRSDVYALGVILYELLAGHGPYEISKQIHETLRTIREAEPRSLRVISRTFRGDIETIVSKALEKDKTRRYASAAELGADIRRYLHDEPIVARPPSTTYQIRKFARRNKALVTGIAAVFVVLVLGIVASTWEALQARRAQKRAQQETAVAQAVNDFLQNDLLGQASAYNQAKPDPNITVRTVLDRAAQTIGDRFQSQPAVEVAIRQTIGDAYTDLALYPAARQQLEAALELGRRSLGSDNPKTLDVLAKLGYVAIMQEKYPEAEKLLTEAADTDRRVLGAENRQTLWAVEKVGFVALREGKYAKAEGVMGPVADSDRRLFGADDRDTLTAISALALVYQEEGKYSNAATLDKELIDFDRRKLGPDSPKTLIMMNNLSIVDNDMGNYAEAEKREEEVLATARRVLGEDHVVSRLATQQLGSIYMNEGKFAQAEPLFLDAVERDRRVMGADAPTTLQTVNTLAGLYEQEGKYAQAEPLMKQTTEASRRVDGPDSPDALYNISNLAGLYAEEGKFPEAEAAFKEALEADRRVMGPTDRLTLYTLYSHGLMYLREGQYAPAEVSIAEALAGQRRSLGDGHPLTVASMGDLAVVYIAEGKFAQAEPLAREVLGWQKKLNAGDWEQYNAECELGASLAGQKKYAEAEPLLTEGYQGMLAHKDHIEGPDQFRLKLAHQWFVQIQSSQGRDGKAAAAKAR
jgi:tetratricopeptide (TPR) repeat protein